MGTAEDCFDLGVKLSEAGRCAGVVDGFKGAIKLKPDYAVSC